VEKIIGAQANEIVSATQHQKSESYTASGNASNDVLEILIFILHTQKVGQFFLFPSLILFVLPTVILSYFLSFFPFFLLSG
jgi:uncharacterized membrane protein